MDSQELHNLRQQFRRAQGSVNYWNNAARAARKAAEKHTGSRQKKDLERLTGFDQRAIAASQQLQDIKRQLTELDPQGARARQLNALRSAIARAKRDIEHFADLAAKTDQNEASSTYFQGKLDNRRAKLAQLLDALPRVRQEAEDAAAQALAAKQQRAQPDAHSMAVISAPYRFNPYDPAELERFDARQAGQRVVNTDMGFERHQPLKPHRPMH